MIACRSRIWRTLLTASAPQTELFPLQHFLPSAAVAYHLPDLLSIAASERFSTSAGTPQSVENIPAYSPAGRVTGPFSVPRQPVFAVVELGPTQYKVTPDDLVYTEKLRGVDVNEKISLNRVLLLGDKSQTVIGRPYVPEASVLACVEVCSSHGCSTYNNQGMKLLKNFSFSTGAVSRCQGANL